MGHTHTAIAGHVRAAHALPCIAAAHHRKASRMVLAARASAHRTRAIARSARARHRSLGARHRSLGARAIARWARDIARWAGDIARCAREQCWLCARVLARCAREQCWAQRSWHASLRSLRARLRALVRGSARCGAARLLPTRDCRALLSPTPIRPLLIAHDTRQGCCLVLVHHALAHCIRAAWATSSLARRRMPALYNTP